PRLPPARQGPQPFGARYSARAGRAAEGMTRRIAFRRSIPPADAMNSPAVALPMYDCPEARASADAESAALRARLLAPGRDAPAKLSRPHAARAAVPSGILDAGGRVIPPAPATPPPCGLDFQSLWKRPD